MSTFPPRVPALGPCVALLIGVALGWHSTPAASSGLAAATLFGAIVALCARRRTRYGAWVMALAVLGALAALAAIDDRSGHRERIQWCLPRGSGPVEMHLHGRVLVGPEPTFDGERRLVVRGRPEVPGQRHRKALVVRLTVRASPAEATRRLDAVRAGDEVRIWCKLFRPRQAGNPHTTDAATALAARGFDALGTVKSARLVERVDSGSTTIGGSIDGIRSLARRRLDKVFVEGNESRALAGAMLLGDRAGLETGTLRTLRSAGLVHLVAISGLHVGLLGCVMVFSLERMRLPAALRAALVVAFLLGFGQLVGLRPSVVRAALAVVMIVAGRLIGRRGDPLNALSLIAAVLIACNPARLFDPGLQLTFIATAGILSLGLSPEASTRRTGFVASGVAVSSSAYLATAPVTAWHFGWIAPICLVTNLAALPLCAVILASGYLAILTLDVPFLGSASITAARYSTGLLLSLAGSAAEVDRGGLAVARHHPLMLIPYYGLGIGWILSRWRSRPLPRRCLALGFALCVLAVHDGPPPRIPPEVVEIAVIDVGQAQSVAARGRTGRTVLVDAGGSVSPRFDPGERIVLPFVLRSSGRRIDSLILSHDHLDHVGGAAALVRELEVGELCLPPDFHRSASMFPLSEAARQRGAMVRLCEWGVRFQIGGLVVRVVAPRRDQRSFGTNDRSVAVVIGAAPFRLLIPGDLEAEGEASLLASPLPLRAEGLVLAHHGSLSASSMELLARVRPRHAIVSCGRGNRFGHPHPAVCQRARRAGATLWRTDLDGMLRLEGRRGEWRVTPTRR